MSNFTYNRGVWHDGTPLAEWGDNETQEEYFERLGYQYYPRAASFGHPDGANVEIFESKDHKTFIATVCPNGNWADQVFLPDFPSFMMFSRDYGTLFSADSANELLREISKLQEKTFQAQHGHSAHAICQTCDPEGWEAQREWRAKNRQTKVASSAD
jgi:hypothetical protein